MYNMVILSVKWNVGWGEGGGGVLANAWVQLLKLFLASHVAQIY